MKRRTFLATVGASAAVALWPRLIRRAFADASFDAPGAKKTAPGYASARARAQQANKPLFVIVVPADDAAKYARGELWGEYLNHADAVDLAPLAQVEVTCATKQDLGGLARGIVNEPLAVVVDPDGSARGLDVKYPAYEPGRRWDPKDDDAVADKRIRAVAGMVARALPPVPADERRALGTTAVRTLREGAPSGSHWAHASACGPATVENMHDVDDDGIAVGYGCGMGHVPAKSSRFLYFFAKSPQRLERDWMAEQEKKNKK
jgi:hypothetical protein